MTDRAREDEMPISPKPGSPVPEIFSSKKIFFLNSSCSGSRRSEIPHIETGYCPRDEVSRRLFHPRSDSCDCDCASDGCGGCLRRNKQCFFKFFVLALSIALVLLLFGSLSYNLTRTKTTEESFEFERTEWVSHYHEYPEMKEKYLTEGNAAAPVKTESQSDLPVPVYEHSEDYDSGEDSRRLFYHLKENIERHDQIEPIPFPPQSVQKTDSQSGILIIYDGREPSRVKRSISFKSEENDLSKEKSKSRELLFEELNEVEEGLNKFWESYFKRGRTVFEPFSLATPSFSTPLGTDEYSMEEEIEDELKNRFLSQSVAEDFNSAPQTVSSAFTTSRGDLISEQTIEKDGEETSRTFTESRTAATEPVRSSVGIETSDLTSQSNFTYDETITTPESETATENVAGEGPKTMASLKKNSQEDVEFRTLWPLFQLSAPLSGLFGSSLQDQISAERTPLDTVKGISLADAKKLKKGRRKHMLLNSRVVGGSPDVRLPSGPDISKPFINAVETLKTNQQLSFTPSAASQFILPYQMCLFAGSFPGSKAPVHAAQPRTFPFGSPPLIPSIFDRLSSTRSPYQLPPQQNFFSLSINNYPNAPLPRQPTPNSGASAFGSPVHQQFSQLPGPNRQPIFCTYLQPPLFQFPTLSGTADLGHAKCVDCQEDSPKDVLFAEESIFPSDKALCGDGRVPCKDGSGCVAVSNWCDNLVQCKDASDEAFCSCRERVARDRVCDGYIDCPHGEDEIGCFDCPKSAFSCDSAISPGSCIPLSKRCDGVRDCATGADEADCFALFFHLGQNNSYRVPQVTGYLHRNWKGVWFPVCVEIGESVWAKEACVTELGAITSDVDVKFFPVSPHYKGPFIVRKEDGTAALQDHCKGHVSTFVRCPAMSCGTRIELYTLQEYENRYFQEEHEALQNVRSSSARRTNSTNADLPMKQDVENLKLKREETGRVVGGRESEPRAWPWAIAVYKNGAFHCGGVILDEKWVLTAAHCMEQYWKHYYEVRGGMLRRFSFSAMEQTRTVSHVIIHENYDNTIMSNDVALLRLREPFHFNRWVRPACLPALMDGVSKFISGPAPGTRCTAVGWGALRERGTDPDQLREVEIPILTRCKHKEDLVGEEICAGKAEGGKDTCQGDSGGPLLCRDSSSPASWYVAGIVSHGEGCARPGEPGAYTRISLFVDWITANSNDFRLPSVKPLQNCPGFRCHSASKLCIPHKWICNGYADCLEAEDEKNCTFDFDPLNALSHQFSKDDNFYESDKVVNSQAKRPVTESIKAETEKENSKETKLSKERTETGEIEGLFFDEKDIRTTGGLESRVSVYFTASSPMTSTETTAENFATVATRELTGALENTEKKILISTEGSVKTSAITESTKNVLNSEESKIWGKKHEEIVEDEEGENLDTKNKETDETKKEKQFTSKEEHEGKTFTKLSEGESDEKEKSKNENKHFASEYEAETREKFEKTTEVISEETNEEAQENREVKEKKNSEEKKQEYEEVEKQENGKVIEQKNEKEEEQEYGEVMEQKNEKEKEEENEKEEEQEYGEVMEQKNEKEKEEENEKEEKQEYGEVMEQKNEEEKEQKNEKEEKQEYGEVMEQKNEKEKEEENEKEEEQEYGEVMEQKNEKEKEQEKEKVKELDNGKKEEQVYGEVLEQENRRDGEQENREETEQKNEKEREQENRKENEQEYEEEEEEEEENRKEEKQKYDNQKELENGKVEEQEYETVEEKNRKEEEQKYDKVKELGNGKEKKQEYGEVLEQENRRDGEQENREETEQKIEKEEEQENRKTDEQKFEEAIKEENRRDGEQEEKKEEEQESEQEKIQQNEKQKEQQYGKKNMKNKMDEKETDDEEVQEDGDENEDENEYEHEDAYRDEYKLLENQTEKAEQTSNETTDEDKHKVSEEEKQETSMSVEDSSTESTREEHLLTTEPFVIRQYFEGITTEMYVESQAETEAELVTESTELSEHERRKYSVGVEAQSELVIERSSATADEDETISTQSLDEKTENPETESSEGTVTPSQHLVLIRETTQTSVDTELLYTSSFDSRTVVTDSSMRSAESILTVNPEYFQCRSIVQSILARYVCDGVEDCEDGTDEENCTCAQALLSSNPKLVCDGRVDCPDRSDENNCSKCLKGEFRCKVSDECIPLRKRCDDILDCKSGEDEAKCRALVQSDEAKFGPDGDPLLETEGVLFVNKKGVWTIRCQEKGAVLAAGEAIEICSDLGTIGYERYENRSVASDCTAFHVTCAKGLVSSLERYHRENGSYLWPWNAFIYSDGRPVCSAVLLQPLWLLTSSYCLKDISLKKNYLVAKLGARSWSSKVKEADARRVRIDGVRVIPESDAALLHLSTMINETESVRYLGIPYAFDSDPGKDLCVAVGDRTVFLRVLERCPKFSRCYKKVGSTPFGCRSKPWVGVVACQSRFGWYPSSVFSEVSGHCGFEHVKFTSLRENLKSLYRALDSTVEVFPEPVCLGLRCSSGLCIPRNKTCNGWPDCSLEEDESFHLCSSKKQTKECRITELKCANGQCIPKVLFGDGTNDCGDESDEPLNVNCVEYLRLTRPERICDGRRNCYDKTDEDVRLCSCDERKFRCNLSGYCVPNDFVCDGERDCPEGEDEEHCMGRKNIKNVTKSHVEVMQKSYGIWHTVCPTHMSKEGSDALCRDLGFKEALLTYNKNQTVLVPEVDAFSWVKLNRRTSIALRGDKPFVRLVTLRRTCGSVKCA